MSASRRQQMANDLAARAIAAAERRRQESQELPADLAKRLADAAGEDGRLTVDDAVRAVSGEDRRRPWNPFAETNERQEAKQRQAHELLFGPPEPEPEPPIKPPGSADGGVGEGDEAEYEWVQTDAGMERMRIIPIPPTDK